jgi:hypothetical protein
MRIFILRNAVRLRGWFKSFSDIETGCALWAFMVTLSWLTTWTKSMIAAGTGAV